MTVVTGREQALIDSVHDHMYSRAELIEDKKFPLIQERNELQDERDRVLDAGNYKLADVLDNRIDQIINEIESITQQFQKAGA